MALSNNLGDREHQKFLETSDGDTAVRFYPTSTDRLTEAMNIIEYEHHEVHAGSSFEAHAVDTTLANAETLSLSFKTPAGDKQAHLVLGFNTLTGGYIELLEGPAWTQGSGSLVTIFNKRRDSTKQSVLLENQAQVTFTASNKVIENVTGVAGGTAVHTEYAFGNNRIAPGQSRGNYEWMLKPDTTYCVCFTSTANSNSAELVLDWYEHTSKA